MKLHHLPLMAAFAFMSIISLSAASASEDPAVKPAEPFVFLLDAEALFGYSDVAGPSEGDLSTSEKWLSSAALKLNEKDRLIGLYNGSFRQDRIFIRQDEGSQASNQLMSHNFSAAVKKYFGDQMIFKPVFFYDMVFVRETADERLGDGLYDYEDLGGGFENTHFLPRSDGKTSKLTYGFNVFSRKYPNYQTLEALSSRDPLEDQEKDFTGYKADTSYRAPWWFGTTGRVAGTFLLKSYTDKHTIDNNGIRENDLRQDLDLEVDGTISRAITEQIGVSFSSGLKENFYNLNFYDTRNTLTLADDRFFENYFNFWAYDLTPSVTVAGPKISANAPPSSLQVSYRFEKTFYPGRTAQNTSGALLNEDQEDLNGKTSAQLQVPLDRNWIWLLAGTYEKQSSNKKFEQTFVYSYEAWSILSGLRYEL